MADVDTVSIAATTMMQAAQRIEKSVADYIQFMTRQNVEEWLQRLERIK